MKPTKAQAELLTYLGGGYVLVNENGYRVLVVTDDQGRRWQRAGAIWPQTIWACRTGGWIDMHDRITDAGRVAIDAHRQAAASGGECSDA